MQRPKQKKISNANIQILTLRLVKNKKLEILLHWGTEVTILQWKHHIKRSAINKIWSQFDSNMDPEHRTKQQVKLPL